MKRTSTAAIVIHTTASNSGNSPEQVNNYFLRFLFWTKGGYNTIYPQKGEKKEFYNWRTEATNGILPFGGLNNNNTIHLSYVGGINDRNQNEAVCNITPTQEKKIMEDIKTILKWYPSVKILGHNQINLKYCPSFWVPDWLRAWGIPERNIDNRDPYNIKRLIKQLPHPQNFYRSRLEEDKKTCDCCGQVL